jgi:cytochrome b561
MIWMNWTVIVPIVGASVSFLIAFLGWRSLWRAISKQVELRSKQPKKSSKKTKIALWFIWFFVLLTVASLMGSYFNGSLLVFYFILSLWFVSLIVYLVHKKTTKK